MSSKIVKTLRPYQKIPLKPLILLGFLVLKVLKTLLRPLRLLQNCYKKKSAYIMYTPLNALFNFHFIKIFLFFAHLNALHTSQAVDTVHADGAPFCVIMHSLSSPSSSLPKGHISHAPVSSYTSHTDLITFKASTISSFVISLLAIFSITYL